MYGEYKRLTGRFDGVLTDKGLNWGGSLARTEATGYGSVYFAENILNKQGDSSSKVKFVRSRIAEAIALYTIQKLYEMGAYPLSARF